MTSMARQLFVGGFLIGAFASGCDQTDRDQAKQEVHAAERAVDKHRDNLATEREESARNQRQLEDDRRALAVKASQVEQDRDELGSAQVSLVEARVKLDAAVKQRFAKLDVALTDLTNRTDAASRDVAAGLRTRRDLLAARIATMPATTDASWGTYTKDLNTTFDGIERDLEAAHR